MNASNPAPLRLEFLNQTAQLVGPAGTLLVPDHDQITRKLFMLLEGQCTDLGASAAAEKFGYSRPRYYQLLARYQSGGATALQNQPRGPKTNYRRTDQVKQQVVRYRFLDPEASASVIGQRLRQTGQAISDRSVERVIAEFGLQKKTPPLPASFSAPRDPHPAQQALPKASARRPRKPRTGRPSDPGR